MLLLVLLCTGLCSLLTVSEGYSGKESWGYINVRKDAYMFWWMYYNEAQNYKDFPLIIWLQGGPGSSSTGFGNFMEIGPLDVDLKPRNTTWVNKANLLFIDNPVGSGYSYVTNDSALATNNAQIAADLVATLTALMNNLPEFQKSPLYIFSESYGGKMTADFSLALYQAIKDQKIICNFKGFALGDSWISPIDSVSTWSQYLYTMSLLGKDEVAVLDDQVNLLRKAIFSGHFKNATDLWNEIETLVGQLTNNVNWYNILENEGPQSPSRIKLLKDHKYFKLYNTHVGYFYDDKLSDLMNGPIRKKLHVIPNNVTWGGQSQAVFSALAEDFMKPVVNSVDKLLNETTLSVSVYTGQLDLIVDTVGTLQWIQKLSWPGLKSFLKAKKSVMELPNNHTAGFYKSFKNLSFYWILKAGHMVPRDAGESALQMLQMIIPKVKA